MMVQLTFSSIYTILFNLNAHKIFFAVYPIDVELKRDSKNHYYLLTIKWSDGSHNEVTKSLRQLRNFHGEVFVIVFIALTVIYMNSIRCNYWFIES